MHLCHAFAFPLFLLCLLVWTATLPLGVTCGLFDSYASSVASFVTIDPAMSQSIKNPKVLNLTASLAADLAEICIGDKFEGDWMTGVFGTHRDWQGLGGCALNFTLDSLDETLRSDRSAKLVQKGLDCVSANVGNGWMAQLLSVVDVGDIQDLLTRMDVSIDLISPKHVMETKYREVSRAINDKIKPKLTDTAHAFIDKNIVPSNQSGAPTQAQIEQFKKNVSLAIEASLSDANVRPDVMVAAEHLFSAMEDGAAKIVGVTLQSVDDRVFSRAKCGLVHRFSVGLFGNALCGADGIGGFFISVASIFALLAVACHLCAFLCCFSNAVVGMPTGEIAAPLLSGDRAAHS